MKKKIVCLVLAVLMVLPLLVGCSNEGGMENINEEAERYTNTLNVWLVTESKLVADASALILSGITPKRESLNLLTDAEKATVAAMTAEQKTAWQQVWQVTDAINKLTKANYRTQLNLKYFLEEDYYAAVEAAFTTHKAKMDAGIYETQNKTEETILNEYGIPELKYPVISDYVVDILFISGQEKYTEYVNKKWLKDLQAHLADSAIKLTSYVSNTYLTAAAVDGFVYALPNNHGVGEYIYMLADKDLMKEYTGSLSDATLYDSAFKEYLDYIYETKTGSNKVYPIYTDNSAGKLEIDFAHYWNFSVNSGVAMQNPDQFSIFGDAYVDTPVLENANLLADANYMKALANKRHYEGTEGYITTDANAKAAIKVVKGSWEEKAEFEKAGYEVMVVQYPQLTDEEIYSSMFGIGAYSANDIRAAEIITYLNTDAEVRNLLQYGVENVNYTLETVTVNEKDYVYAKPTKDNIYLMDVEKTGNTAIAYPNDPDDVLRFEYDKAQNLEMIASPTLGLNFSSIYKFDETNVAVINAVSKKLKEAIDNMSYQEVLTLHARAAAIEPDKKWDMVDLILEYTGSDVTYLDQSGASVTVTRGVLRTALILMETTTYVETEGAAQSPYYLYYDWCMRIGLVS